jgi:hypothetical protein
MGDYLAPSFNTTTKTTTPGGAFTIKEFPTSLYDGAFIEYTVVQGSDARAGTLMAIWNGTTTSFTETTTTDIGNTTDVIFDFASTGTDVAFRGNASAGWIIKCIIRAI